MLGCRVHFLPPRISDTAESNNPQVQNHRWSNTNMAVSCQYRSMFSSLFPLLDTDARKTAKAEEVVVSDSFSEVSTII